MAHTTHTLHTETNSLSSYPVTENNWAFLDLNNIVNSTKEAGWLIDMYRFRNYLRQHLGVTKAVVFLGWLSENESFYNVLHYAGFELEFREVMRRKDGSVDGGNVDADLTGYMMDYKAEYSKAVVIADDGDFTNTIKSLIRQDKLKMIISTHPIQSSSHLIRKAVQPEMMLSIQNMKNFLRMHNAA